MPSPLISWLFPSGRECQTEAAAATLFVTALGEILRQGKLLHLGQGQHWERHYRQHLTGREFEFVKKVYALQDKTVPGRFRVYGQLTVEEDKLFGAEPSSSEIIVLVTEFKEFARLEDKPKWLAIKQLLLDTHAHLWVMDEEYELEHSYLVNPDTGEPIEETFGERHGWPAAQVELSWRIEKMSVTEMEALQESIIEKSQALWEACGVGVI